MKKLWRSIIQTYPLRFLSAASAVVPRTLSGKRTRTSARQWHAVQILALVVFVFAGDRMIAWGLKELNMSSQFRYSRLYDNRGAAETLLLGNSRGHCLFQPSIQTLTGRSTLNLSYNALPASISRALVEDYYDIYDAPKKMIIEVTMLNKTDKGVINEFKLYIPQSGRLERVISGSSPATSNGVAVANLYGFNTELFQRSLYYLGKSDEQWIPDKQINAGMVANEDNIEEMLYVASEDRLYDFKMMLKRVRNEGTQVQLVLAPFYPAFREKIANLPEYINQIEKATGLKVHDYSSLVKDNSCFSDYMHLNRKGSKMFMQQLFADGLL